MTRILIVDDHAIVRQGLKQILNDEFASVTFGEADNAVHALELVRGESWHLVILDISLPGRNGLDLLKEIKRLSPKIPVIIHSMHREDLFGVRVLKAGAAGFVSKTDLPEKLLTAVRRVLSGGTYVSSTLAEKLISDLHAPSQRLPHETLSDRELQVMQMIAAGKSTSEIADELSLSLPTISTYRLRILEKLNIKTNAELIVYVFQHNLIPT